MPVASLSAGFNVTCNGGAQITPSPARVCVRHRPSVLHSAVLQSGQQSEGVGAVTPTRPPPHSLVGHELGGHVDMKMKVEQVMRAR